MMSTCPFVFNDRVMVQTVQKTLLVPQLQFIDVGLIMQPQVPAVSQRKRLRCSFCPFEGYFSDSVHLDVESRLSADFLESPR